MTGVFESRDERTSASAMAVSVIRYDPILTLWRVSLSLILIAAVGSGCQQLQHDVFCMTFQKPECVNPPPPPGDCIRYVNGQSVGTAHCGPYFDRDNDSISTNTETNAANSINNVPVAGFYSFSVDRWDLNLSQARGVADNGSLFMGMNLTNSSEGYHHYDVCDGVDRDDWGTGHLVRLIEATGRLWLQRRDAASNPPDAFRMGWATSALGKDAYLLANPGCRIVNRATITTSRGWTSTSGI